MSNRCNNIDAYPVACASRRVVLLPFRGSCVVPKFSHRINANSINRKRFSAVDTWASITPACAPRIENGCMRILGWRMRQLLRNARSPGYVIYFFSLPRLSPQPKGQIASILVSTALKPQLLKTRQLNGARHVERRCTLEMHPSLRLNTSKNFCFFKPSGTRNFISYKSLVFTFKFTERDSKFCIIFAIEILF